MVEGEQRQVSLGTKIATVSPTKKISSGSSPGPLAGGPSPPARPAAGAAVALLTANTRRLGRKLEMELVKGPQGLGFSITTRDNPTGDAPVYVKNILPKGAAVEDGRLRPGDRLLQVNDEAMTGKTQADAVAVLRAVPPGAHVRIVISRQDDGSGNNTNNSTANNSNNSSAGGSSPHLPRQMVAGAPTVADDSPVRGGGHEALTALSVHVAHPVHPAHPAHPAHSTHEARARHHHQAEKSEEDALVFPWKHKEILTFDIPVHDTEKAGLGVSVKGKTSTGHGKEGGDGPSVDLGIFVKSVLHGGAASRDGRLRTNDQLLNVNGVSLLGQTNAEAMETLRRAMLHTEGPVPGVITLTVARRTGSPRNSSLTNGSHSSLKGSHDSNTIGGEGREIKGEEVCTPDNSGTSENSDNTVIFLPYATRDDTSRDSSMHSTDGGSRSSNSKHGGPMDILASRNPVLDRLTGQMANSHALRNESYYRATNDTWNTTMLMSGTTGDRMTSPTVNQLSGEMVLIEEEFMPPPVPPSLPPQERGVLEKAMEKAATAAAARWSDRASDSKVSSEPGSEVLPADATYASQLSLEDASAGFSRDAFGRQSMSEKRHAALDAKNTDTYQRNKRLREERERQRHLQHEQQHMNDHRRTRTMADVKTTQDFMVRANSIESIISLTRSQADSERSALRSHEVGPALGMKKSSSLESLQTLVQELQMQEECGYRGGGSGRAARSRGCNESFRAAVDRSYEAPLAELRSRLEMETLAEEEVCGTGESGSRPHPADPLADHLAFAVRGGPRQSSLNSALDAKHKGSKKKPSILRGIGSMFRFGKHRKPMEEVGIGPGPPDGPDHRANTLTNNFGAAAERAAARRAAEEEQQRIQEQYRRLQQQQQQQRQRQAEGTITNSMPGVHPQHPRDGSTSSSLGTGGGSGSGAPQSRVERIHELRAQHQRRHAERQGRYPLEAREERYEEAIRQRLEDPEPGMAASYDLYGEMGRPGSRAGISDPARFSHYVNYEEIQQHLNRRQQHYHSQRRETREPHHRPVSNFYEYESIQSAGRPAHQWGSAFASTADANSNSLPRHAPLEWAHKNNNNNNGGPTYSNQQKLYHNPVSTGSSNFRLAAPSSKRENPLPMVHNLRGGTKVNNLQGRPQGPFVTQVLIGEQPPAPGSKV